MERLIAFCMIVFTTVATGGCCCLNGNYESRDELEPQLGNELPEPQPRNELPEPPKRNYEKRIDLTRQVIDKVSVKKRSETIYLPTSLYWAGEDSLLLNVYSDNKSYLKDSFLINPSTGAIRLLELSERRAFQRRTEDSRVGVKQTEKKSSTALEAAAFIATVLLSVATHGGSGSGSFGGDGKLIYTAKIENNGSFFDIDIETRVPERSCLFQQGGAAAYANYTARNKTGTVITGSHQWPVRWPVSFVDESMLKEWLQTWRISPDGRNAIIDGELAGENENLISLIEKGGYGGYSAFDVSPRWDRIALLYIEEDATNQTKYWVEFYPFALPVNTAP